MATKQTHLGLLSSCWSQKGKRIERKERERYYKADGKGKNIRAQKVCENEERNTVFEGNTVSMKLVRYSTP